uniref:Uncharacterized protein n=1 Tax=Romanomermis culicivorax TaxID=13658 RepID=A0A915HI75_ROMCU
MPEVVEGPFPDLSVEFHTSGYEINRHYKPVMKVGLKAASTGDAIAELKRSVNVCFDSAPSMIVMNSDAKIKISSSDIFELKKS